MKPIAGLNRDVNPIDQPPNTMRYAANGLISDQTGLAENIQIEELIDSQLPSDFEFIGWILGKTQVYVFGKASAGQGEIWRIDPNVNEYGELIIIDPGHLLGFNVQPANKLLQIVFQEDFEEHEVFAWVGEARPRILDIGLVIDNAGWLTGDPAIDLSASGYTNKSFLLFPEGELLSPFSTAIDSDGNVFSGAWMWCYRYVYSDFGKTNFSGISNSVYVTEDSFSKRSTFSGDVGNRPTSKSITVGFNIDASQPNTVRIEFGYISIREGVIFAGILDSKQLSQFDNGNGSGTFTYTGESPFIDLGDDISQLITPKALYTHAETITSLTSRLYIGNLRTKEEANIQLMLNDINVNWKLIIQNIDGATLNEATFGPGEVYALYASILYNDGTESRAFTIPGRKYITASPSVSATSAQSTFEITVGPATGGLIVGFTLNTSAVSYSVPTVAGDTNLVIAAALEIVINAGGIINATDQGGGVIKMSTVATGSITNETLTNDTTDTAFTINSNDFTGGADFIPEEFNDDDIVLGYEKYKILDTGDSGGRMGYWRNNSEEYPSTSDFANVIDAGAPVGFENKVRHHRLPTIGWMYEKGLGPAIAKDMIAFNIALSNIDQDQLPSNAIGMNFYYAKRKIGEIFNLSTEVTTCAGIDANTQSAPFNYVAITGPYAFSDQDVAIDPLITTDVRPTDNMLRFHDLKLLSDRPAINPLFIVKEKIYFADTTEKSLATLIVNSDLYTNELDVETTLVNAYKYGVSNFNNFNGEVPRGEELDRYVSIEDYAYVKNGVKYSFEGASLNNNAGEDAFIVYKSTGFNETETIVYSVPNTDLILGYERFSSTAYSLLPLLSLRAVPGNVSVPFDNQVLISSGNFKTTTGITSVTLSGIIYGDTFNGGRQFRTTGVAGMGPDHLAPDPATDIAVIDTTTQEAGIFKGESSKIIYNHGGVSIINTNAQYADPSDVQSYIPDLQGAIGPIAGPLIYDIDSLQKLKSWYCYDQNIYESLTVYYNDDFHRRPEYFIRGINDGFFNDITDHPFTLAFSLAQRTDVETREWRNWLLLNKYVQPSEKGPIINLKGAGNQMLYIHHRYSLYTTKDRLTLDATSTSVTLGSEDIFAVTPYELVSVSEGHTGLQNKHWQTLSPFGYSWIQSDHGKVYTHDGKSLDELSGKGMRVFFRDELSNTSVVDDIARSIINDDLRRRIIVSTNITGANKTIAYSTAGGFWSFFQDNLMTVPLVVRDKNILIRNTVQNTLSVATGGYDNFTRPFIIEAVMNDGKSTQKYLQYLKWNTNVFDNNSDRELDTFNKLAIYSSTKIYGTPSIDKLSFLDNLFAYSGFPKTTENVRRVEGEWLTNSFRDLWDGVTNILTESVDNVGPNPSSINETLTWDKKGRMRDKYLIVRLSYDKPNGYRVEFESLDFGIKNSIR